MPASYNPVVHLTLFTFTTACMKQGPEVYEGCGKQPQLRYSTNQEIKNKETVPIYTVGMIDIFPGCGLLLSTGKSKLTLLTCNFIKTKCPPLKPEH